MEPQLHPATRSQLNDLLAAPKGSYVFYGPEGIGRFTSWLWIMRSWHGHATPNDSCQICIQIQALTYPDLVIISPEGESIGVAQIQALQRTLHLSRYDQANQRLVIIDSAGKLTLEAQNALLKVVEEPPADTIIALLAASPRSLLSTLRSRAQAIHFMPLTPDQIKLHLANNYEIELRQAEQLAELADGRLGKAIELLDNSEQLEQYQEAALAAEKLCSSSLFDKLKLATQLGDSKATPASLLSEILYRRLRQQLRNNLEAANFDQALSDSRSLKAVIIFDSRIKANVTLKAALGALALELTPNV